MLFQPLKVAMSGIGNVDQNIPSTLTLGDAPGQSRAFGHPYVVFILFE